MATRTAVIQHQSYAGIIYLEADDESFLEAFLEEFPELRMSLLWELYPINHKPLFSEREILSKRLNEE